MNNQKVSNLKEKMVNMAYSRNFHRAMVLSANIGVLVAVTQGDVAASGIIDTIGEAGGALLASLVAFSTVAAGIGVAIGAFMKKFSMGKPDKIETGNKLIKDSLIAWATINGFMLIIAWLEGLGFDGEVATYGT